VKVTPGPLEGLLIIEPRVFSDSRGYFLESFHAEKYAAIGIGAPFVQDNSSHSVKDTLRGLHFQNPKAQGKLVSVSCGSVFDVAVDIRKNSKTFGQWFGLELSDLNRLQLWVPPGFAHGFCVLSEVADFHYKCTNLYAPDCEQSVLWNDEAIGIAWPTKNPRLSQKDADAPTLKALRDRR
jgi:dTDP-4-dehydrorhamnose 3,5-epimerase